MSSVFYHIKRISALVQTWDRLRGPGQALLPEDVAGVLEEVRSDTAQAAGSEAILDRMQTAERRLMNVLTDAAYNNDDRDREVIAARMALCGALRDLRALGGEDAVIAALWAQNDCDEWCV